MSKQHKCYCSCKFCSKKLPGYLYVFSVGNKVDGNSELIIDKNATYTNDEGQEVPIDNAFLEKIRKRIRHANQTMHGAMNEEDKGLIHQHMAGRFIMNCCADDIQLFGFLADDTLGLKLKDRQWIHLKANISYEWSEEYNEEELVLKPISIDLIEGPKDKVLDLTK